MNKQLFFVISLFLALNIFSSCEKVIQLDLKTEKAQLVIEAVFNIDSTEQYVYLSKTVNFDNDGAGYPYTKGSVQLFDGELLVKNFDQIKDGMFHATIEKGTLKVGKQYTLQVKDLEENTTHIATSTCPVKVELMKIQVNKNPPIFGRYNYQIIPVRNEPYGKNWYQFRLKKNKERIHKIFVDDDSYLNGKETFKPILDAREFSPDTTVNSMPKWIIKNGGAIELKDSVEAEVTLVNIEYKVFRYLYNLALNQGQGGRQSATPTNPDPIFTNGALGYFSIQSSNTKEIWVNNKLKL